MGTEGRGEGEGEEGEGGEGREGDGEGLKCVPYFHASMLATLLMAYSLLMVPSRTMRGKMANWRWPRLAL